MFPKGLSPLLHTDCPINRTVKRALEQMYLRRKYRKEGSTLEKLDKKIARFNHMTIEILVSALVSLLASTFVLYCAGVI